MTPAELDTLALALPVGARNGTTEGALSRALGWDKGGRKVREGFQLLRRERHLPVVALTMPNGVYIADGELDIAALERTADGLHSRAMSELVTERDLREIIADLRWSPTLFDEREAV